MPTLRALRDIALDHATTPQPDLAGMARELGRMVYRDSPALAAHLAPLRARQRGFEHWLLATRSKPAISLLVLAWPPNHRVPAHDHAALWELKMPLLGALEVQSYGRDSRSGELCLRGRDWLGPGDGRWFDRDEPLTHGYRNLSRHDTAFTLHVFGGAPAQLFAGQPAVRSAARKVRRLPSLHARPLPG